MRKQLPTWAEITTNAIGSLDTARGGLADARDWLRSDWDRADGDLTTQAASARIEAGQLIGQAKDLIDQAKNVLYGGLQ